LFTEIKNTSSSKKYKPTVGYKNRYEINKKVYNDKDKANNGKSLGASKLRERSISAKNEKGYTSNVNIKSIKIQ